MNQQIVVTATGAPSVMQLVDGPAISGPGPGQVHLRHEAIGVNFVDTMFRSGAFKVPLPLAMGVEGAGTVAALRDRGRLVHVGNASGAPEIDHDALAARAIGYVQPSTGQHVNGRDALERASATLFAAMRDGVFGTVTPTRYPLLDAVRAHEDIAARHTVGPAILLP